MNTARLPRRLTVALVSLAIVAVGLTVATVAMTVMFYERHFPSNHGWSVYESVYFPAGWASVLGAQVGGLWLWYRAPRNPTGRWLWLAGTCLGLWFVGTYWPNRWGMQLTWAVYFMRPALAMAFVGWPTGRPTVRVRLWIVAYTVANVIFGVAVNLFGRDVTQARWPADPLAPFAVGWVFPVFNSAQAWLLGFIPTVAVMIVLVRRRRRLSSGARRLVTPITVAGLIVGGSDLVSISLSSLAGALLNDNTTGHTTLLGGINLAVNYAQAGLAAIGLLVAMGSRRRAVAAGDRRFALDLGHAPVVAAPTAALQRFLDDPTARVLYRRPDGVWVDTDGAAASLDGPHRSVTRVVDGGGVVLAAIETDTRLAAHSTLIEVAAATLATRLTNERVSALAKAREAELAALQHALLDATDAARQRLERDLHDGAQQCLVGLALAARLAARGRDSAAAGDLRSEVLAAREELLALLDDGPPAVLAKGLAAALATLAATSPLVTELHVSGDLDPSDRLARTAWFIANEAVANAVKHAHAGMLRIEVAVDPSSVTLRVVDDGRGGLVSAPRAIAARAADADGTVTFSSAAATGTDVTVVFARERGGVAA